MNMDKVLIVYIPLYLLILYIGETKLFKGKSKISTNEKSVWLVVTFFIFFVILRGKTTAPFELIVIIYSFIVPLALYERNQIEPIFYLIIFISVFIGLMNLLY